MDGAIESRLSGSARSRGLSISIYFTFSNFCMFGKVKRTYEKALVHSTVYIFTHNNRRNILDRMYLVWGEGIVAQLDCFN